MTSKKPGARYFRGSTDGRLEYYSTHDPKSKCIIWWGCLTEGYGCIWDNGERKRRKAHILAYELANGPVAEGKELHHRCKNKRCVNPDHLELVTRGEHLRLEPTRWVGDVTHCKRGHEFTPKNTYFTKYGRRTCRICHAAWQRDYKRRILESVAIKGDRKC